MNDLDFLNKDYFLWHNFAYLFMVFCLAIFLRYIILSELYIRTIYKRFKRLKSNRILSEIAPVSQRNREIMYSFISSVLFAFIAIAMIMLWQEGYTKIYLFWSEYPFWYHPLALLFAALIHETYYYWLHRWMHHKSVYKYVHRIHHESINTSAWTSFSFHPLESLLQAIIIPLIVIIIPIQIYVLLLFLILMTLSAIINHAGVEIFPKNSNIHWLGKYFIGATHHDQHHRKFLLNYGLYFTFWDELMGTESSDYHKEFQSKTSESHK
jgi:Delta7-sterol 5-desaturase